MSDQNDSMSDHPNDLDVTPDVTPLGPTPTHGYWRSLRELDGQAPFQTYRTNQEFPTGAGEDAPIDPLSRRNFFQLMGASMALAGVAGAAGCQRYEKEEIVPLSRRPEDQIPGVNQQYASAFDLGGVGHPLLVTAFEGRPIHLDGNPEHPFIAGGVVPGTERHGAASTFALGSILHLYDPDRSQAATNGGKGSSVEEFRTFAQDTLRKALQAGGRVLSEATSSPTVAALRRKLKEAFPALTWHEYEPLSWDNERLGTKLVFGRPVRPLARLDRAETIVTLDGDIFVEHPASLRYSRDFARSRRHGGSLGAGKMNRLWSVESTFTNTGALADHRLPLRSDLVLPLALALDAALSGGAAPTSEFLKEAKVQKFVAVLAEELRANAGRAVIVAGRRQPPEVHALVAKLNGAIGAVGQTLDYVEDPEPERPSHLADITKLAKDMAAGQVPTLIILGGNPVYDAPADLEFAKALEKVKTSVHLHEYVNETSQKTTWHVPRAHFLEAWGDVRTWDGTITVAQPVIAPLYGGLATSELLAMLVGEVTPSEQLVRDTHTTLGVGGNWRQSVHDGFVPGTQLPIASVALQGLTPPALTDSQKAGSKRPNGDLEVAFHFSSNTYDGRFANNAWLQETPDFLTKVTWDNYALVSPETATDLGLTNDTMIKVKVGSREITVPCYTMPGQARYSIGLVLGGGRTAAGSVGGNADRDPVGFDTYKLRQTTGWDIATAATVSATGESYTLANIQEHWDFRGGLGETGKTIAQDGIAQRLPKLVRETTAAGLGSYRAEEEEGFFWDQNPGGKPRGFSLFEEKEYTGHRWGMAIDLNTCTGCNSCMVACQSENNVPVVGRQEVMNNREMSWIRIDRYFSGSPDDPQIVHQPVGCQHCENAPCEQVCPVGATTHSTEGLNDMAYNRCIGTRYCANNCPYKVRRFNFLDWNKEFREARNKVRRLLFNPDVTVRMRGVMEKCTYCVQRIQGAKIKAKAEIRSGQRPGTVDGPLADGEIVTACQAACPTEAIVFGDLADKESRVARLHEDARAYALLPETYTKPRTRFLARVRNPNPKMQAPGARSEGGHE
jgi:molybdopterin-containing oxidoreductase family iron-sulfur binding subunit